MDHILPLQNEANTEAVTNFRNLREVADGDALSTDFNSERISPDNVNSVRDNLNSDIKISYNYTFSNNKEFKVSLKATYHTYMDYNCRYNDDITWSSELIIKNEEDKTIFNLENINEKIEDLEDEMEGLEEAAKLINKVLSYIDEDNREWNDMIKYVGDY